MVVGLGPRSMTLVEDFWRGQSCVVKRVLTFISSVVKRGQSQTSGCEVTIWVVGTAHNFIECLGRDNPV